MPSDTITFTIQVCLRRTRGEPVNMTLGPFTLETSTPGRERGFPQPNGHAFTFDGTRDYTGESPVERFYIVPVPLHTEHTGDTAPAPASPVAQAPHEATTPDVLAQHVLHEHVNPRADPGLAGRTTRASRAPQGSASRVCEYLREQVHGVGGVGDAAGGVGDALKDGVDEVRDDGQKIGEVKGETGDVVKQGNPTTVVEDAQEGSEDDKVVRDASGEGASDCRGAGQALFAMGYCLPAESGASGDDTDRCDCADVETDSEHSGEKVSQR